MFFDDVDGEGEVEDGKDGKTTTAFGMQAWLNRAVRGEMETPIFVRSVGDVREKEFDLNLSMSDVEQSVPSVRQ